MRSIGFLLLGILFCATSFAQEFSGIVVNEDNQTLGNVIISDTLHGSLVISDINGSFKIKTHANSVFEFNLAGYEKVYVKIGVLTDTVVLHKESKVLHSITINSSACKPVLIKKNINVLDYIVYPEFILTLYKIGSQRYLSLENNTPHKQSFRLEKVKAKSLYEDCFGNVHLVTKDSIYQIWIDKEVNFITRASISDFHQILSPCIAAIDSNLIISDYSIHNKKYTLSLKQVPEKQFHPFFSIYDLKAAQVAEDLYWEITAEYMASTDSTSNIIMNKMWDGKSMYTLASTPKLIELIGFYNGVISKEINVHSFQVDEHILTFDLSFDSIHVFNRNGHHLIAQKINDKPTKNRTIIMDKMLNTFYCADINQGICSIRPIDLSNGNIGGPFEIREFTFIENIQIFNGWAYFLKSMDGFRKLYRVKIPE